MDARAFEVDLAGAQPSQLYVDGDRLATAIQWFDLAGANYDPVPVVSGTAFTGVPDDRVVLTDGHTRAVLAHLAGHDRLLVVEDEDWPDIEQGVYRACVRWCLEEQVTDIVDLVGRVIDREAFSRCWVDPCERYRRRD